MTSSDVGRVRPEAITTAGPLTGTRTIRPGPYPSGGIPAHVHFVLRGSNPELQFADDPRVDPTDRKNMARDGTFAMVRPVTVDPEGVQHVSKEFRLQR